jgi:uncharacterized membrane protein
MNQPRPLLIGLVLSLALNVFMVGGALYIHLVAPPPPPPLPGHRLDVLAERLKLRPEQMAAFEEFHRALRRDQEELAAKDRPLLHDVWEEIAHDNPDAGKIQALVDQMAMHRHAFQIDTTAAVVRFAGMLSPEQRIRLSKAVMDHHEGGPGGLRNLGN